MRIFLSFNSKDLPFAEAVRAGFSKIAPDAQIFFSPVSLGAGFWLPKLAEGIADADAFLLLIGPKGIGPWQEVEYFTAFDRHMSDKRFVLVPVMTAGAAAPGLSFLRTLNWVEAPVITEDNVLHRLLAALKGETVASTTPLWKLVNPYRGLEAMTEANADYFFGRTRETAAALTALAEKVGRCPILIGASGIGKSSVAQAGVLSALKSMRWPGAEPTAGNSWPQGLQNSRAWIRLTMRPGDAPLEALAGAMIRLWQLDAKHPEQAALPHKWAKCLFSGDNALTDLIGATQEELKKREGEAPDRMLLYIDQGEELYTRATHKDANRFSEVLAEGLSDPRLRAFASMRSDYFGRLQADEPLFKCHEHVDIPPLDHGQLDQVVTAPARSLGVAFEDAQTANRITTAAASEPGALPLLSYLLTDMWAVMVRRGDATLRLPAEVIDVGGILASRAEEFLKGNPNDEKPLRRLLTLKLASVPPEGEPVRRQTSDEECTDAEWRLARRLAEHPWRLVVIGERAADRRIVAEVAHEALLRAWPRLTDWLRNEREFLIFKGDAERAERRWHGMSRADSALLTGLDLTRAEGWLPSRSTDLPNEVLAFAQRSIGADRAAKQRQLRFQRSVAVAAVAAAMIMAVLFIVAGIFAASAQRRGTAAVLAESRILSVIVKDTTAPDRERNTPDPMFMSGDPTSGALLAQEGLFRSLGDNAPSSPALEMALYDALLRIRETTLIKHTEAVSSVAFSPDGQYLVTASADHTARLWHMSGPNWTSIVLIGHSAAVNTAAFSRDGHHLATGSDDHTARLWDLSVSPPTSLLLQGHSAAITQVAFSRDGLFLVTASDDNTARLWDMRNPEPTSTVLRGHDDAINSAAFSPDSRYLVTTSWDHTARLWDLTSGHPSSVVLSGHTDRVVCAVFSPDGRRIVTTSNDGTARLWEFNSDIPTSSVLERHDSPVNSAQFSPDGSHLATVSDDHTAHIWNLAVVPMTSVVLRGHSDAVNFVAFSPDGLRVATGSNDRTIRLWDMSGGPTVLKGHAGPISSMAFSPDGRYLVTGSDDRTVRLWDLVGGQQSTTVLRGHNGAVNFVAYSPDGSTLVSASDDNTVRLWPINDANPFGTVLRGPTGPVNSAAFSPDGRLLVAASSDHTIRLWDLQHLQSPSTTLSGHTGPVNWVVFSPDGQTLATASDDHSVRLWNAKNPGAAVRVLRGHAGPVSSVVFSPDGRRLATASWDQTVRLWDLSSPLPSSTELRGHSGAVNSVAFSPDGRWLVSTSHDQTARLWDLNAPEPASIILRGDTDSVNNAAFSPDGRRLITVSSDHDARLWDFSAGQPISFVLEGHSRPLTSVAFAPDGRHFATGSWDQTIRVWVHYPAIKDMITAVLQQSQRCLTSAQRSAVGLASSGSTDDAQRVLHLVIGPSGQPKCE